MSRIPRTEDLREEDIYGVLHGEPVYRMTIGEQVELVLRDRSRPGRTRVVRDCKEFGRIQRTCSMSGGEG